jgi:DNA-binding CsgD family transcriptional regulator
MIINSLTPRFNLPSPNDVPALAQLTSQERKILLMTLNDCSCKEIADSLNIAFETVKRHRKNIIRKLEVSGKTEFRRLLYLWTVQSWASVQRDTVNAF